MGNFGGHSFIHGLGGELTACNNTITIISVASKTTESLGAL